MKRILRSRPLFIAVALACVMPALAHAQQGEAGPATERPDPDPTRFAQEMAAFATFDSKNFVPALAVLFVGSSSIRFWPTAERFPGVELINRGFGGAHISDVNHFIDETVLRYRPNVVVFYAGDNDLSAGKAVERVYEDYLTFVEMVLHSKPSTQIVYLPVKPSLARWAIWPEMQELNALIRARSDDHPNLRYSDVATPMLGPDGEPAPYLFVQDGLHMTPAGYDIWTEVVGRSLARIR